MTPKTGFAILVVLAFAGAAAADHGFDHPVEGDDEFCDPLTITVTDEGNVLSWEGHADESGADPYAYYAVYGAPTGWGMEMILITTLDVEEDNTYEFNDTPPPPFSVQYKVRGE